MSIMELGLFEQKDQVLVSSRTVAKVFGKRHDHVVRDIREIQQKALNDSLPNFGDTPMDDIRIHESTYVEEQNGQTYIEFLLNKDAFTFVVMGFTGDAAFSWKRKYIAKFNAMEAALRERSTTEWLQARQQGKVKRRLETDAIMYLIPYAIDQGSNNMRRMAYTVYTQMVHRAVGIVDGTRDTASIEQLMQIAFMENIINITIFEEMRKGTHYKDIFQRCKEECNRIARYTIANAPTDEQWKAIEAPKDL